MIKQDSAVSTASGGTGSVRQSKTHVLKCWPEFFKAIAEGQKRHDLRRADDRDFRVGDSMLLREFDPASNGYTGQEQLVTISYITSALYPCALSEMALNPNYCILSIALGGRH